MSDDPLTDMERADLDEIFGGPVGDITHTPAQIAAIEAFLAWETPCGTPHNCTFPRCGHTWDMAG